jgi:uncharacterized protein
MLVAAFTLGLTGSLHCASMCSPLAFAVTNRSKAVWANRVLYNIGRLLTYGTLGAVVSTLGVALPIEKIQTGLSVGMGVLLIIIAFLGIRKVQFKAINTLVNPFSHWLKGKFSGQIQRKNTFSFFLLGTLNGLLPCGLSAIALTACLIAPTALDGFYFMLVFGAGTLPVMLGFMSIIQFLVARFQLSYARVNAIMLIVAGCVLIARAYWPHQHPGVTTSTEIVVCED